MEIERAKAISQVAQTLIETAKVEVKYMELVDRTHGSEFIEGKPKLPAANTRALNA